MMTRRTLDGALKWALRDFLREEWRAVEDSISTLLLDQGNRVIHRC